MDATKRDLDILARTLYGEAEAGNRDDAIAIACVIINRVNNVRWPDSPAEVCLQPWQFSCWNQNDPNRQRILKARGEWFNACTEIAADAISGTLSDITNGATHYYETGIAKPKWAKGHKPSYAVMHRGGTKHAFYNDIDTKPPASAREALEQVNPVAKSRTVLGTQVAAGATLLTAVADNADKIAPAVPVIQSIAEYAPWVLMVVVLFALAYIWWARIDDRKKGLR